MKLFLIFVWLATMVFAPIVPAQAGLSDHAIKVTCKRCGSKPAPRFDAT